MKLAEERDYTFRLMPGKSTRYLAGSFNATTRTPRYEIEINVPSHVQNQIKVEQILTGTKDDCQWAWDIENKSSWPAFILVKKDGQAILE